MRNSANVLIKSILFSFIILQSIDAMSLTANSPGINGVTGLISTPTANLTTQDLNFGMDVAYHYIYGYVNEKRGFDRSDPIPYLIAIYLPSQWNVIPFSYYLNKTSKISDRKYNMTHVPSSSFSVLKIFEFSVSFDSQNSKGDDMIIGSKILIYGRGKTPVAVSAGGTYQSIKIRDTAYRVYQAYLASTFNLDNSFMPSSITLVLGKHFGNLHFKDEKVIKKTELDFSIGYDADVFPKLFENRLHWINEFANYSYSRGPSYGSKPYMRGSYNMGFRIVVFPKEGIKLNFDVFGTDLADRTRGFVSGVNFGLNF